MKTNKELKKLMSEGLFDSAAQELFRYGEILTNRRTESERYTLITYKGLYWEIEQEKGKVVSVGWSLFV